MAIINWNGEPAEVRRQCYELFDSMGEPAVRAAVATGDMHNRKLALAKLWLLQCDERQASREREADRSIPRESNRIARRALWLSAASIVVALYAAIVATYAAMREFPISDHGAASQPTARHPLARRE